MKIIYSDQPIQTLLDLSCPSIFLVGPTPRSRAVKSWRPDAIVIIVTIFINWAKHSTDAGTEHENNGYHLDRKNTNNPYSLENCVVCCNRCNYGKSNMFSYDEWYDQIF